jgi:hypothetical protein
VTLAGALAAPEAHGAITLAGGRAYIVPLGVTYDPVDVTLGLEGAPFRSDRLTIQSGKGGSRAAARARLGAARQSTRAPPRRTRASPQSTRASPRWRRTSA